MAYRLVAEYTASVLRWAELQRLISPGLLRVAAIEYIHDI